MSEIELERVFVAIDVLNLYHSGQDQFGRDYRVNYAKLIELIKSKPVCMLPRHLEIVAYVVTPSFKLLPNGSLKQLDQKNTGFITHLGMLGIKVKNRNTYFEKGILKPMATDWDVGISIDALNLAQSYDTFCLISGDGDFAMLVEDLKTKSKFTEIITFEKSASRLLCAAAHRTSFISKNEMFKREFQDDR
jgi:uncharacterized LabA/DUF88 family protein